MKPWPGHAKDFKLVLVVASLCAQFREFRVRKHNWLSVWCLRPHISVPAALWRHGFAPRQEDTIHLHIPRGYPLYDCKIV